MASKEQAAAYVSELNTKARQIETKLLPAARQTIKDAKQRRLDSRGKTTGSIGLSLLGVSREKADDTMQQLYMYEDRIEELARDFAAANRILTSAGHALWQLDHNHPSNRDQVPGESLAAAQSVAPQINLIHAALTQISTDFRGYTGGRVTFSPG